MEAIGRRVAEGVTREAPLAIEVDGTTVEAFPGETVAAALIAVGRRVLRWTKRAQAPRGVYCGIGLCFDCLVTVDGRAGVRACQTPVRPGMRVTTRAVLPREGATP
jgi:predicted molibdopterin-dependent oxidoreductase YjgC